MILVVCVLKFSCRDESIGSWVPSSEFNFERSSFFVKRKIESIIYVALLIGNSEVIFCDLQG